MQWINVSQATYFNLKRGWHGHLFQERFVTEAMEGRGLAKGNLSKRNAPRTLGRIRAQSALRRIRQAARRDRRQRFTALFHHVYDVDQLREAYYAVKRTAAPGVDGRTWLEDGKNLEENLQDLGSSRQGCNSAGESPAMPIARFRHVAIPQSMWVTTCPLRGVNGPAALRVLSGGSNRGV